MVVTFTNAAASEMRGRILDAIYKQIEKDENNLHLQRQITLLNKASICTIHSFCLDVIRNNFYEIGASANFRIGDTTEIELLKQEVIEEIFEQKYIEKNEEFINLINTYTTYRGDEPLKDLILNIYKYIQSTPEPKKWLQEKVEFFNTKTDDIDFSKTIWGEILIKEFKDIVIECKSKSEKVKNGLLKYPELEKWTNIIINDIEQIEKFQMVLNNDKEIETWDKLYNLTSELAFVNWARDQKVTIEYKTEAKEIRDEVKDKIGAAIERIFKYDSKTANEDIGSMYKILKYLSNIILEFSEMFADKKKEKNIIDFNDIEHFALNILIKQIDEKGEIEPSEVALKYKNKFNEILIDEYQDSNLVQEYILNSISNGNNIFMVGDVKQSIYKFRQARPELFLEKYENYNIVDEKQTNIDAKIKLFKNFRSRKNILDVTNIVFENIMSKELGDIDYNEEEYLNLGANYIEPKSKVDYAGNTELHIIDLKNDEEMSEEKEIRNWNNKFDNDSEDDEENQEDDTEIIEKTVIEAKFVANKVKELVNSQYQVFDKNKKIYRKITYKDIVILLRATSVLAPIYEKELNNLNIPVYSDTSSEYLEATEIQTIMSLLKIIDNPLQDIPLVTVMRSEIGGFTDNELVQIRLAEKQDNFYNAMIKSRISVNENLRKKIEKFIDNIENWRQQEKYKSLDELIWQIYIDTNYYNYVGLLQNGKLKQANLKMLFQRAKQYETASFKGLFNFINFIDKLKTTSTDMSAAKVIGENENVVRIMSIHKSKGLEFPVVFLCSTGKQFNMQDLNRTILLHQDLGFGPKYIDYEKRIEYNTLAKEALKVKTKQELISEEMRVLYVALTRAKEKLIVTGVLNDLEKDLKEKQEQLDLYKQDEQKINQNILKKYISYLGWLVLVYLKENPDTITLYKHKTSEIEIQEEEKQNEDIIEKINKIQKIGKNEEISELLKWKYKHNVATTMPTKTSVTNIKEMKQQNESKVSSTWQVPKFMKEEKVTNSQKGTLMHLCVQKLNEKLEYDYNKIKELVQDLKEREIITESEMNAISIGKLLDYTKSSLWNKLKNAKEVKKEQPFYINISSKEVYQTEEDENILVQGIIDLYFIDENDKLILVDYKTDYVENGQENSLKEKYKEQLELYKRALESSTNKKVDNVIIYSLYLQKELEFK